MFPSWTGEAMMNRLGSNNYTAIFKSKVYYSNFTRIQQMILNFGDRKYPMTFTTVADGKGFYYQASIGTVPLSVQLGDHGTPVTISVVYEYDGKNSTKTSEVVSFDFLGTFDGVLYSNFKY